MFGFNDQQRADAKASESVLPHLFETEKEVIMEAKGTMHGLAIFQVPEEMITHLDSLGLAIPASNIGGFKRPAVLTNLGCKVSRHLRAIGPK